jgi:hypothetical protein
MLMNNPQTGHVPMTGTSPLRDGTCGLGERRDMGGETPPYRGVSRVSRLRARVPLQASRCPVPVWLVAATQWRLK